MSKVLRGLGIVLLVGVIVAAVISGTHVTPNTEKVWDEAFTIGSMEAKNYFIAYTDLACPYCIAFEAAILKNEEDFMDYYINGQDILFEVRVTEFLYEFGEHSSSNSRTSAIATYCAKNEGRFWDYYKTAVLDLWDNYYSSGSVTAASGIKDDYWISLGTQIGLGESFESCVKEQKTLDEVKANTKKAAESNLSGMPSFQFNSWSTSGFLLEDNYEYVMQFLDKGLNS